MLLECVRNLWWGVSVEDRRFGLPRIDHLRRIPLAARFLSVKPLIEDIGSINLDGIYWVIGGGESGAPQHRADSGMTYGLTGNCKNKLWHCFPNANAFHNA
jgi:protein gp37